VDNPENLRSPRSRTSGHPTQFVDRAGHDHEPLTYPSLAVSDNHLFYGHPLMRSS